MKQELSVLLQPGTSEVTVTVLGEEAGVRVFLRKEVRRHPELEDQFEYCQRCWTDLKTGTTTCVPITCPSDGGA